MIIPDNIDDANSRGEKLVFRHFKNDTNLNGAIILHSLFISKHLTRLSGELDFLVLAPEQGIFALEVKHGQVRRKDGLWEFEDRNGKVNTSTIGPFRQVSDTMHSLRSYLLNESKQNHKLHEKIKNLLFGWGVMFTSLDEFNDFGTEAEAWQIFTRGNFRLPGSHFIHALSKGFHNKYVGKRWYDTNNSRPTKNDCEEIFKLLRGDFSYSYSSLNQILDEENLIEHFTEEQFETLSIIDYNDRVLIQGGAGTGKTIMATEWFQRNINLGKKVAFITYNRKLGVKLNYELSKVLNLKTTNSYVGNLHSYMHSITGIGQSSSNSEYFYENELPLETILCLEEISYDERFDLLIIDEAQDLLTESYLDVFDTMIKGGLKEGSWVLFGDFCNQLIYQQNPKEILELLSTKSTYVRVPPLKTNCRNSKKIVLYNSSTTGCEKQFSPEGMLEGERVEHYFPIKAKQTEKIIEIIEELIQKGVPLSKITLLTTKAKSNSELLHNKDIEVFISNGLNYSTIQSYKGLQNSFVIASEFDELQSDYAISLMYIAISRAKLKFYFVLDKALENTFNKLITQRIIQNYD